VRRDNFFSKRPDLFWGAPSFLCNTYRGYFPGYKQPWRLTGHSTPSSAEVKNECSYTSTSTIRLPGGHRDKSAVYKLAYRGNGT